MASLSLRPTLQRRLSRAVEGSTSFNLADRGRYSTDASFYQMMPLAVVSPRSISDVEATVAVARDEGVKILPRGGGTSQSGQAINDQAIALDFTRHLDGIVSIDPVARTCVVEPGIVLDELNRALKPHGLWFPVDVSTASRATIGGMAGNNSCGTRSIRYGTMRDNVRAIRALTADGRHLDFAQIDRAAAIGSADAPDQGLFRDVLAIGEREKEEIEARFPDVLRRVGGYNLDALIPSGTTNNLSHLLVGSEGTLACFTQIELALAPLMGQKSVGVCHFASFHDAMDAAQHIVTLGPTAVELVDATMIALARDIAMFRPTLERFVRGAPDALLIVEFAEDDPGENARRLRDLGDLMGGLGYAWSHAGRNWGGVVEIHDSSLQAAITNVRQAGLNIMMSMKDEGKPVSFVEDCAVPLPHLAEFTARLTDIFERHGTRGTWYAHASVGCLHVRPVLNLKQEKDVKAMRAIAEEAFEAVREFKGSHSGEHGDGLVRSEFHEVMFGSRIVRTFEEIKDRFDPAGLFNPGKIVRPPRMDDRSLFRYPPGYAARPFETRLDWSDWHGEGGGFQGAVEMCNNNGACRNLAGGVMCPSFRATREERDSTRGRANTLRLALSGQIGADGLAGDEVRDALELCVSCKGCRRECPTGVDMAKMKIEASAARAKSRGIALRERLVAYLPRYAPYASRLYPLLNLRDRIPGLAWATDRLLGLARQRPLPRWRGDVYSPSSGRAAGPEVVLFADTFNTYFDRENLDAAVQVLEAGGYRVHVASPPKGQRPLCCGRTFLSAGLVDAAREEAARTAAALLPFAERGIAVVGLEPSCLFTLRDEWASLLPAETSRIIAEAALSFEEFVAREVGAARMVLPLAPLSARILLHGHCHQKAFAAMTATETVLRMIPSTQVEVIESSCCGMAGSFGYQSETYEVSMRMGELSLLPAVRAAPEDAWIVADGTSCRQQIRDGAAREAVHVARMLKTSLDLGAGAARA